MVMLVKCTPDGPPKPTGFTLKSIGYGLDGGSPLPLGFYLKCDPGGTNCQDIRPGSSDGCAGPLGRVADSLYNQFYLSYATGTEINFLSNNDWSIIFPDLDLREDAIQNVLNGIYSIKVLPDSSIIIVNNSSKSYTFDDNIVVGYSYKAAPCNN